MNFFKKYIRMVELNSPSPSGLKLTDGVRYFQAVRELKSAKKIEANFPFWT
jgi:hypothetical protein